MSAWIVVVIVIAVLALLAVGGAIAQRRHLEATRDAFAEHLERVNAELAAARAEDRGWELETMEAAARAGLAQQRPDAQARTLALIQVVDRPGTEEDKAVFRVEEGPEPLDLTLGRRAGAWVLEELRPAGRLPA